MAVAGLFRLVVAVLLVLAGPAGAQAPRAGQDDVFTVADVAVDVTDATAAQARERALLEGQRQAFQRLMQRLATDASARPPRLDEATMASVVRSIDVSNERTSAVRYLATLTIRFNPGAVRDVLAAAGISFTETRARPMLLVPVYSAGGSTILFEDRNPWREAWARRPQRDTLVPIVVPLGDLRDIADLDARQAMAGDTAKLEALARRYGAADSAVAVAVANVSLDPVTSKPIVALTVIRHSAPGDSTLVDSFTGEAGDRGEALLARAVDWVERELERLWKDENAVGPGQDERHMTFAVPIASLAEWTEVRRRLGGIGLVRKADVLQVTRQEGRIAITYVGEPGQLKSALAQRDLELIEGDGEAVLRLTGPVRR
ncbi:MAG: DUF2066 domain-containing protein [Alphaproteobacteria bacterium]|nr:DUF2066 domain-containing protein [Alphaproteobacteria bacterium]